mmetsp:Transcript_2398/g.5079  ORF Transcript_2398/g.5079 Transcript_2398/m.5079 type:complete len:268 (+) Transcript_2398:40-843(+)
MNDLDFVENLTLGLSSLEVFVSFGCLLKGEDAVDRDVQLAFFQPSENFVGSPQEFFSVSGVIEKLGSSNISRLSNETQDGEGRDGTGGVSERNKDSSLGQRANRDIDGALSDSINDTLGSLASSDLHHLFDNIHALVVLKAGAGDFVEDNELVASQVLGNVGLSLGNGTDDLETTEFRHLGCPLAGTTTNTVNKTPLTLLDQIGMGRRGKVVGRQSLNDARCGNIEANTIRNWQKLGSWNCRVFSVGLKDGVGNAVTDLNPLCGRLI